MSGWEVALGGGLGNLVGGMWAGRRAGMGMQQLGRQSHGQGGDRAGRTLPGSRIAMLHGADSTIRCFYRPTLLLLGGLC